MANKTLEDFNREYELRSIPIKIVEEYIENNKKYVKCKCDICGGIFSRERKSIANYRGCPICEGLKVQQGINDIATTDPWAIPYFKDKNIVYNHSKYSHDKADVFCTKCGKEKKIEIYNFLKNPNSGCLSCEYKDRRKTIDDWNAQIQEKGGTISIIGEHIENDIEYVDCKCNICSGLFSKTRANLRQNHGCPICSGHQLVKGINDIATTDSWLLPYLKDKEFAYTHTRGTLDRTDIICPKCGYTRNIKIGSIMYNKKCGCPKCNKKYTLEEIREKYTSKYPDIQIQEYNPETTIIKCKCLKCGGDFERAKYIEGCPICSSKFIVPKINSISATDSWLVPYFIDENFARTHTRNTKNKTMVKCIVCGYERMTEIGNFIKRQHFYCPCCSDTVSYPNIVGRTFIRQLPVEDLAFEYSPEWAERRSYDIYFKYKGKEYIVEMDGDPHYRDTKFSKYEDYHKIDLLKDQMCKEHNIEMIRINCMGSRFNHIKKSIMSSKLAKLFDLNIIDWDKCDVSSPSILVREVCNFYMNNPNLTIVDMSKELMLSTDTISRYLKKGNALGLCVYNDDIIENNKLQKLRETFGKHVKVFTEDMKFIGEYASLTYCIKELRKLFPNGKFSQTTLKKSLDERNGYYNGFIFQLI